MIFLAEDLSSIPEDCYDFHIENNEVMLKFVPGKYDSEEDENYIFINYENNHFTTRLHLSYTHSEYSSCVENDKDKYAEKCIEAIDSSNDKKYWMENMLNSNRELRNLYENLMDKFYENIIDILVYNKLARIVNFK